MVMMGRTCSIESVVVYGKLDLVVRRPKRAQRELKSMSEFVVTMPSSSFTDRKCLRNGTEEGDIRERDRVERVKRDRHCCYLCVYKGTDMWSQPRKKEEKGQSKT